jgi:putative ABC transport system permease protein
MRDLHLVRGNLRRLARRSRSFGLSIMAGVAVALFCAGLVGQAVRAVDQRVLNSSIMRTIEVSSYGTTSPTALTADRMAEMARLPEVVSVQPWIQSGCLVTASDVEIPVALWATPRMAAGQPPVLTAIRDDTYPLADNEAILPARIQGRELRELLGREITVEYTRRVTNDTGEPAYVALRVVGLYDETIGGRDGPAAIYLSLDTALVMAAAREGLNPDSFGRDVGFPKVVVEVSGADAVRPVQLRLSELGYNAATFQSQLEQLPAALALVDLLGKFAVGTLVLLCLFGGLSTGAGLVSARIAEIGLLKALGFSGLRIARLVVLELGLFALVASAAGVALGGGLLALAQQLLRGRVLFDRELADAIVPPSPLWIVLLLGVPTLAMIVGAILPVYRAAKLPPDVALRRS